MPKNRFAWTILLIALALMGGGWILYSQVPSERKEPVADSSEAPIAGYLAPEFTLRTANGEQISLGNFRGQPVVLNFWASWCPPCRAEIPHFQSSSLKYNGHASILGIDQGEPASIVADFGASLGVTYPLLVDADNSVNRQYRIRALPTTIFIDADGVVREVYTGIVNSAVLGDRIERLMAETRTRS